MNNMPYQFFPQSPLPPQTNIYDEIKKIQEEINILKEKINSLENQNKKDYLKKDDSLYIL